MSTIIALASPKGGVGKSTLAIMLAGELAHQDKTVTIIDADPQLSVYQWWERCRTHGRLPENMGVVRCPNEVRLNVLIEEHDARDVIIIDLQGAATRLAVKAAAISDIVVIPSKLGLFNADEVQKLVAAIRQMAHEANVPVPTFQVVLNEVNHVQKGMKQYSRTLQVYVDDDIGICGVMNDWRPTYVEVTDLGGTLYHLDQKSSSVQAAIVNIQALLSSIVKAMEPVA